RVRDVSEGVLCSLWALGRPLEDHLLLSPAGDLLRVLEPAAAEGLARPIAPDIRAGVAAAVAAGSGAPLAPAIEDVARAIALEWGAVTRDLILVEGDRIRVSESFRRALAETLAAAGGRGPRATAALTAVVELAGLLGDELRARAQARLAALPPEAQARALDALGTPPPADGRHARAIAEAIEALLSDVGACASGDCADDEPDVEGEERRDRERREGDVGEPEPLEPPPAKPRPPAEERRRVGERVVLERRHAQQVDEDVVAVHLDEAEGIERDRQRLPLDDARRRRERLREAPHGRLRRDEEPDGAE